MTGFFNNISISEDTQRFVRKSIDIGDEILNILKTQGKSQKDLATLLGKTEPEISKWLSGTHNFTLKTIAKIETALGKDVIIIPTKATQYVFSPLLKGTATAEQKIVNNPIGTTWSKAEINSNPSSQPNKEECEPLVA